MREKVARDRNHEENGAAWDIVARAKYEAEMEEHIEFLRAGGHTLLDPELEALLKSYDAFLEARGGSDEQRLFTLYESRLEEAASNRSINHDILDRAVRRKYPGWVKANIRPSTLPPKA